MVVISHYVSRQFKYGFEIGQHRFRVFARANWIVRALTIQDLIALITIKKRCHLNTLIFKLNVLIIHLNALIFHLNALIVSPSSSKIKALTDCCGCNRLDCWKVVIRVGSCLYQLFLLVSVDLACVSCFLLVSVAYISGRLLRVFLVKIVGIGIN